MVSNPSPSSSFHMDSVDAEGLARLAGDDGPLCVIDCRAEGPNMRRATRLLRLPQVLLRRLQSGSMRLQNVFPQLTESNIQVVVVPESPSGGPMSSTIMCSLQQDGYSARVFRGDAEQAFALYPQLVEKCSDDVSFLNLKALRIEPEACLPRERRQQVFPVEILPHLFLGNAETAGSADILRGYKITHVVNVTSNLPNAFEEDPHYHYLRISVDDNCSHNLSQFFSGSNAFIQSAAESGGACLVHCLAGISRSVTVCIAYLMSSNRWTLEEAYDHVLRCNGSIAPNFHFMGQLSDYERHLGLSGQAPARSAGPPLSPSCSAEAAHAALQHLPPTVCLTPPPTSCSASPQSSSHSAKSFD